MLLFLNLTCMCCTCVVPHSQILKELQPSLTALDSWVSVLIADVLIWLSSRIKRGLPSRWSQNFMVANSMVRAFVSTMFLFSSVADQMCGLHMQLNVPSHTHSSQLSGRHLHLGWLHQFRDLTLFHPGFFVPCSTGGGLVAPPPPPNICQVYDQKFRGGRSGGCGEGYQ